MENESFRDRITTVDDEGKRKWIYAKKPKGKFTNYRTYLSYVLLGILFLNPWIKIGGEPMLMFNIITRKFVLFGQVFWPHDFYLFALIMITFVVFIVLFTTIYGRVFCGWICPQTIFMEHVFRKIEYFIDGDYKHQLQLKKQKWDFEKIAKRGFKYSLFYLISFIISNTFLAYIIGADELWKIQTEPLSQHLVGFLSLVIFSWVFFFVFAWFREQVCLIVCPYGRLQGVMLDRNSLVVAYDYIRGEGRAKYKKNEDRKKENKGDCIDCNQCVDVCPTGIDIRNGTQLECINCTACIDACDFMMEKTNQPKGLIRVDSENAIAENKPNTFSTRSKAYTAVLVLLVFIIIYLFTLRGSMEATILRTPGTLYQEQENGIISNLYNVKAINKSNKDLKLTFEVMEIDGTIKMVGSDTLYLPKGESSQQAFFVNIAKEKLPTRSTKIKIGIFSSGILVHENKTTFSGPAEIN
ncbi:MAG: cytochrome c oxidase accessory protein CcoG [Bacteroidetes bacterium HGW-Bacteroidetes-12]|nr:MAG: cytochrome c oxidase accessory protein CcoG [Bacteroidetes bacterium HGW-Bacteroidetes-12]